MIAAAYPVRVNGALDRPFQLGIGGIDPGTTLSLSVTPEPCDIQ
jgi:hypothetical protein